MRTFSEHKACQGNTWRSPEDRPRCDDTSTGYALPGGLAVRLVLIGGPLIMNEMQWSCTRVPKKLPEGYVVGAP